jgi:H+/Cl- antiporter ClcA
VSKIRTSLTEHFQFLLDLVRWIPVTAIAGMLAGVASAFLLVSLDWATNVREAHHWLILLLAPVGLAVGMLYKHVGSSVEAGNNLILEEIHKEVKTPSTTIPLRMTPLILAGTILTHLFGGSAGREGTAIQTGASLADQLARPFRLAPHDRRILLMAGISGGFASVFGTPLAGAVFGIEVLAIGSVSYEAIAPCFLAAFVADLTARSLPWPLQVHHTIYPMAAVPAIRLSGVLYSAIAGAIFGLTGMAFARSTHAIAGFMRKRVRYSPLRPFLGGLLVTAAVFGLGTTKYIGLGIPTIVQSFQTKLPVHDFAAKFLFTTVTLGTGFKGGEVTPLFFIGATLGNALSRILPLAPSLLAGMGFAAVFAGAANTPIASTLMAIELFGAEAGVYAGIACVVSYLCSGHAGIYHAQRVGQKKHGRDEDRQ